MFTCSIFRKLHFPRTVSFRVSPFLYGPHFAAANSHLCTGRPWPTNEGTHFLASFVYRLARGGVHTHAGFWVTSKLARQPFAELHRKNTAWFTAVLLGVCVFVLISYFAQNIHRHISEQLRIKGRVRVGWLMCRLDECLRVVSRQGRANSSLCAPSMRAHNVFRKN